MEGLGSSFAKLAAVEQRGVDATPDPEACGSCGGREYISFKKNGYRYSDPCHCVAERFEAEREGSPPPLLEPRRNGAVYVRNPR